MIGILEGSHFPRMVSLNSGLAVGTASDLSFVPVVLAAIFIVRKSTYEPSQSIVYSRASVS